MHLDGEVTPWALTGEAEAGFNAEGNELESVEVVTSCLKKQVLWAKKSFNLWS